MPLGGVVADDEEEFADRVAGVHISLNTSTPSIILDLEEILGVATCMS